MDKILMAESRERVCVSNAPKIFACPVKSAGLFGFFSKYLKLFFIFSMILSGSFFYVKSANAHPFITNPGTLLDDFEDVTVWGVSGTGASSTDDTSLFKQGTQSVKLNATGGNIATLQKINLNLNLSSGDGFSVWIYIVDVTKISGISLYITSQTNYSKMFTRNLLGLANGWNRIYLAKSDFTNTGGEDWANTMVKMKFVLFPVAGQGTSIYFDDFRFGIVAKPKVIITFDDGYANQLSTAYPIMAGNSQKGVAFIITNSVGTGINMTLANMDTLRDAGWDISNHTSNHIVLTTASQSDMEAAIDDGYNWLATNGFGATAKFFAYPGGQANAAVIAKVKQSHILGRSLSNNPVAPQFDIVNYSDLQYKLGAYNVANTTSVATVEAQIDRSITLSGVLILTFHSIVDANASVATQYLTANFQAISDYLKTKQDAGLLDVITFSDYYNALTADWITVSPTSGLTTTEAGETAEFTVVLTSQPTADVTIGLSSSDITEGTVSPSSLTFTSANYNTPQAITVTGVDDYVDDGNISYTVVTAAVSSSDPNWNDLNPSDVSVSNTDNDTAGVTITESAGSTDITEGGVTDSYNVVLTSEPTADVVVTISPDSQSTTFPSSLTFTSSNWSIAQTVTVTAVDDDIDEGAHTSTITHSASSMDANYASISISNIVANIVYNATAYNVALATVTESNYTPASWATYQTVVLANVVTISNTQEEVDAATANIITAQANLVLLPTPVVTPTNSGGNGGIGAPIINGLWNGMYILGEGSHKPLSTSSIVSATIYATSSNISSGYKFTTYLKYGMKSNDVKELQKYLNSHGFVIAQSGAGALGKETNYFGLLTYKTLIKFQEYYKKEILIPLNLKKGTGYFGKMTIDFINK